MSVSVSKVTQPESKQPWLQRKPLGEIDAVHMQI